MTTISIQLDEQLLARARELAAARHMTVEQMVERLLRVVVAFPKLPKVSGHNPCLHGCAISLTRVRQ